MRRRVPGWQYWMHCTGVCGSSSYWVGFTTTVKWTLRFCMKTSRANENTYSRNHTPPQLSAMLLPFTIQEIHCVLSWRGCHYRITRNCNEPRYDTAHIWVRVDRQLRWVIPPDTLRQLTVWPVELSVVSKDGELLVIKCVCYIVKLLVNICIFIISIWLFIKPCH